VDTVLLGCNGVDPVAGVTNVNLPEAAIKRRMIRSARRRIVLADGSKIGRVGLAHLCPIDEVHQLITGESADPAVVQALRDGGCDVQVAS
jgi:DeoR family transcriptional regulator of aga operon